MEYPIDLEAEGLEEYEIIKTSDTLWEKTRTGHLKFWRYHVLKFNGVSDVEDPHAIATESWQIREEGAERSSRVLQPPIISKPKNVGRSNETTSKEQALSEAESKFAKKRDRKGYRSLVQLTEGIETVTCPTDEERIYPMLAKTFGRRHRNLVTGEMELVVDQYDAHKLSFPMALQPKRDGVRALTRGKLFWSRTASLFPKEERHDPRITQHLELPGVKCYADPDSVELYMSAAPRRVDHPVVVFDGELIITGLHFQDTVKATRKYYEDLSPLLEYHVFDLVIPGHDVSFEDRWALMVSAMEAGLFPDTWDIVETHTVETLDQIVDYHERYIEQGLEGTILRQLSGMYAIKHRSDDLQKLKDFFSDEFKIVGVKEGDRTPGRAILICETNENSPKGAGIRFDVKPKGTHEYLAQLLQDGDAIIGLPLTVEFGDWTKAGKPSKPIGIEIRDYE